MMENQKRLEKILSAEEQQNSKQVLQAVKGLITPNNTDLRILSDGETFFVPLKDIAKAISTDATPKIRRFLEKVAKEFEFPVYEARTRNSSLDVVDAVDLKELLECYSSESIKRDNPKEIKNSLGCVVVLYEWLLKELKFMNDTKNANNGQTAQEIPFEKSERYKVGKRGEEVFAKRLRGCGYEITENPPGSLTDLTYKDKSGSIGYIECKVRNNAFEYCNGRYECYTFPQTQIDAYAQLSREENRLVYLCILNPTTCKVYCTPILDLLSEFRYEDKVFPEKLPRENKSFDYIFFVEQFKYQQGLTIDLTQEEADYINSGETKEEVTVKEVEPAVEMFEDAKKYRATAQAFLTLAGYCTRLAEIIIQKSQLAMVTEHLKLTEAPKIIIDTQGELLPFFEKMETTTFVDLKKAYSAVEKYVKEQPANE